MHITAVGTPNKTDSVKKKRGGKSCCVPLCGNKSGESKTSFHSVPVKVEERTRWLILCKADKKKLSGKCHYVCGEHFSPADFTEATGRPRLRKEAVPNKNLPCNSVEVKRNCTRCGKFSSRQRAPLKTIQGMSNRQSLIPPEDGSIGNEDIVHRPHCDDCSLRVSNAELLEHDSNAEQESLGETFEPRFLDDSNLDSVQIGVQAVTDLTSTACQTDVDLTSTSCQTEVTLDSYPDSSYAGGSASVTPVSLKEMAVQATVLHRSIGTQHSFKGMLHNIRTNKEMIAFTGVTSEILTVLEGACETVVKLNPDATGLMLGGACVLKERIAVTLCKLKLDLSFVVLGALCGVSDRTLYSYFTSTISILACALKVAVYWPEKEEVLANIPNCFQMYRKTRVVLDCTEIQVEKPQCLKCRTHLYSHYKSTETVKVCVGITPCGVISFVSEVFGGRASDKAIVNASGILDKLLPQADAVMVDKGFAIDAECEERHIDLIRPPFACSERQMSQADALRTKSIAKARVHVERAIQRMKVFEILKGKLEWSLVPFVDRIMIVIAGVVNLSPPILSDERFLGEVPL